MTIPWWKHDQHCHIPAKQCDFIWTVFYDRKIFPVDTFQPVLALHPNTICLLYHTGNDTEAGGRQVRLSNPVVPMRKAYRSLQLNVIEPFALSTMSVLNEEDHLLIEQCRSYPLLQESSFCKNNFMDGASLEHLDLGCQAFVLNGWKDVLEKELQCGYLP